MGVLGGRICRLLMRILLLRRKREQQHPSRSNSALGSDWLQRTSSSSWELSDRDSSDEEDNRPCQPPADVPEGCLAVYAGTERRRFVVGTQHLSHPLFKVLLARAEEEYGFDHAGAISVPCGSVFFEQILSLINNSNIGVVNAAAAADVEMDEELLLNEIVSSGFNTN